MVPLSSLLEMPATCQDTNSWSCAAVYDWTGNEALAHAAAWLIGKPLAILPCCSSASSPAGCCTSRRPGGLPGGPGERAAEQVPQGRLPGQPRPRLRPPGPARGVDGQPAEEHRHRRRLLHRRGDGDLRARLRHRPAARQRRRGRGGVRLRRAEPGQGLPLGHLHAVRGPVRRRRRGRPRRGLRHGRGGDAAGHPAARRRRHGLVRAQRRDPPGRQPEPELGPVGAGHLGQLRRGPRPGPAGAPGGRPRAVRGRELPADDHRGARGVGRAVARPWRPWWSGSCSRPPPSSSG